jgi:glutamate racemase
MIGIFDSGVGGLSVYQSIAEKLPKTPMWYVSDNAYAPYGTKSEREIRDRSFQITRFLRKKGAKIVVIACNTATTVALDYLRDVFPDTTFVGTEPPIKTAIELSPLHRVLVLTTEATARSPRLATLIARTIQGKKNEVHAIAAPEFVDLVEQLKLWDIDAELVVRDILGPQIDDFRPNSVVVGATHFSFLAPLIQRVMGTYVPIFDAREGVSVQVKRSFEELPMEERKTEGATMFYTTGNRANLKRFLHEALSIESEVYEV